MGPISGLWRDTWWLWCVFMVALLGAVFFVTPFFLFMAPAFVVMFLYFAFVRYDENGKNRGDM
ncbi:hypothetical protein DTL21_13295 [Bremerella cremea]|uniref:Uncharacterized protein n=1 Tax=Blastopirellula marina TaxID=124 RepID=A0A2S8FQM7_9BACT|nr:MULTISPECIES: hypothetical protein [Pirellulaceae]PQO34488.1 hypothetical protein C5Y83_13290 [Blastopirellula marina]RCS46984.1 hypothetical protein DTL21_13295 [Bremerella cremea]